MLLNHPPPSSAETLKTDEVVLETSLRQSAMFFRFLVMVRRMNALQKSERVLCAMKPILEKTSDDDVKQRKDLPADVMR
jgi:hypothetical protein